MTEKTVDGRTTSPANPLGKIFQEAYERQRAAMSALEPDKLETINFEITGGATTALGALPALHNLREQAARLPDFDISHFDLLGDYARALLYTHAVYQSVNAPVANLPLLNEEATHLRAMFTADMAPLLTRKLITEDQVAKLTGLKGYKNVAWDLVIQCTALRSSWGKIAGGTALQLSEMDRAEELADLMLVATGERKQVTSPVVIEATLHRQQAYTLFSNAYDQDRRAVTYLRWKQGDADEILPSLYAKQGGHSAKQEPTSDGTTTEPASPPHAPADAPHPTLPGLPGGSPFIR
jgi:hypothetical protein